MRYSHLPVFQKAYDLNLYIFRATHNFQREYKYTLGQKMKETTSELMDWIIAANSQKDKTKYFPKIKEKIERLRIQTRTAYDLKIIRDKKLEYLNRFLEDISKQVSGWENWHLKNKNNAKREIQ